MKTGTFMVILALLVFIPVAVHSQIISVTGKVLDNATGTSIQQLTVVEKKSGIGTISAENGKFFLYLQPGEIRLDFFGDHYELYSTTFLLQRDTTLLVNLSAFKNDSGRKGKKEIRKVAIQNEMADNHRDQVPRE